MFLWFEVKRATGTSGQLRRWRLTERRAAASGTLGLSAASCLWGKQQLPGVQRVRVEELPLHSARLALILLRAFP